MTYEEARNEHIEAVAYLCTVMRIHGRDSEQFESAKASEDEAWQNFKEIKNLERNYLTKMKKAV